MKGMLNRSGDNWCRRQCEISDRTYSLHSVEPAQDLIRPLLSPALLPVEPR